MTGFKNFILRGNLVELAVALIMAPGVRSRGQGHRRPPDGHHRQGRRPPRLQQLPAGGLLIGVWITAVISFLITAAVVYYAIVKPYTVAKERYFPSPEPGTPDDVKLLQEIRDLLVAQNGGSTATVTPPTP